jgi:hypothetical protein
MADNWCTFRQSAPFVSDKTGRMSRAAVGSPVWPLRLYSDSVDRRLKVLGRKLTGQSVGDELNTSPTPQI